MERSTLPLSSGLLILFLAACAGALRQGPVPPLPGRYEGLDAEYRLIWKEGSVVRKARLAAALRPPHRVRLEVFDPLGGSRAVLVATEEGVILLDPSERVFRRFASGSDAFEALSGMKIPTECLAALLLGDPGVTPGWSCRPIEGGSSRSRTCTGPDGAPSVTLRRGGEEWEVRSPGSPLLQVDLEASSGPLPAPPGRIRIQEKAGERSAELILRQLHFGAPPDDLFIIQPPPSFQEVLRGPSRAWILGEKP